jgi:hypothetical protein
MQLPNGFSRVVINTMQSANYNKRARFNYLLDALALTLAYVIDVDIKLAPILALFQA